MTTIRVIRRERFTIVDRETINDDRLSFRARGILVWLLDKPDGWSCDSQVLADAAKEGREAVRTALNELVEFGYIVRYKAQDERGRWASWTEVRERPGGGEEPDAQKPVTDVQESDFGSPDPGESGANPKTDPKTEIEDCSTSSSTSSTARADASFEVWWGMYPKKAAAKGEARKRWRDMLVKDRAAATEGLIRHVAWWAEHGTEPQYIPSGAVWLNQRRWEDEQPRTLNGTGVKPDVMEQARLLLAREGPRP